MRLTTPAAKSLLQGLACAALLSSPAQAQSTVESWLGGKDPSLTKEDLATLAVLERNRPDDAEPPSRPVLGRDNTLQYVFGGPDPTVFCAPFKGCDIRLQPGEVVRDPNIGDTRWFVDLLFEGVAPNETPHILVNPFDVGLDTTLVITTDRRTYHLHLVSHSSKVTQKIAFIYPEDIRANFVAARARQERERAAAQQQVQRTAFSDGTNLTDFVFAYDLAGRAPWKPLRVYNDGERTYIDFPQAVKHTELPTLLILRTEGDILNEDELVMVNTHYDPSRLRLSVDSVFDRAVLLAGVGRNQVRVVITRLPPHQ